MQWNQIRLPGCDHAVTDELKGRYADLQNRIEELSHRRSRLSKRADEAKEAALSAEVLSELAEVRIERIVTWQTEIAIRNDVDLWLKDYRHVLQRDVQKQAFAAIDAVGVEIRARLVGIGYRDVSLNAQVHGKITPGMIITHPEHVAASARLEAVRGEVQTASLCVRENHEGRNRTEKDMRFTKDSMASVA